TCELSGSIASASNLMFTQQIDGIDTSIQDDIGIQVLVTGKQLFGCGKMWLNISGQAPTSNEEITKSYNFEEIAQDWDSDTDLTLLIPIDDVKKVGNNIQISVLAGDTAESAIPFKDSDGNAIEIVVKDVIKEDPPEDDPSDVTSPDPIDDPDITQPTKDSKGISTGVLIGIIVGAVAVVAVIVIIIVVSVYCDMDRSTSTTTNYPPEANTRDRPDQKNVARSGQTSRANHDQTSRAHHDQTSRAHHDQTSRTQRINTHRAHQGSGRRARHYEMEENNW
ncbi:MAG: hypothetical protein EZS28_034366, partial [Streblomastix strix]